MKHDDRELLEMAAKAAEIGPVIGCDGEGLLIGPNSRSRLWNPIIFDSDALRLANHLGLTIGQTYAGAYVDLCCGETLQMTGSCQHEALWADFGGDKNAACRHAIVLCAAQIGRSMP